MRIWTSLAIAATMACGAAPPPSPAPVSPRQVALADVAAVHGAAGPFAVAGYRMGARALALLGVPEGAFQLQVVHESPAEVQWSCIADGAQAATGVSIGKLNLERHDSDRDHVRTVVRDRKTGRTFEFVLVPSFVSRFWNTPYDRLRRAGEAVMDLSDDEIFAVRELSADLR